MGPGPGAMHPRVAAVLGTPLIGHLDPVMGALMDSTRELLKPLFGTRSSMTLTISATGGGGREAVLTNLIEPGDRVVVEVRGYFGGRLAECAKRLGADLRIVEGEWGAPPPIQGLVDAIESHRPAVVAVVHAETSTGAIVRPEELKSLADAAHGAGAVIAADCVTSVGSVPLRTDAWGLDAAFGCSQKGLACPPGLAPITLSDRALAKVRARRTPPPSVYFDLTLLEQYWGPSRVYHHTASSTLALALHTALEVIHEEGIEARWARLEKVAKRLVDGCAALGLPHLVARPHRMPMVTPVRLPEGLDEAPIRRALLLEDGIEIGAGLGPLAGKIWRIGLMGDSARDENVDALLTALERRLPRR